MARQLALRVLTGSAFALAVLALALMFVGRAMAQPVAGPLQIGGVEFENQEAFVMQGRRCATPVVSTAQRLNIAARMRTFVANNAEALRDAPKSITIPVLFHVIHNDNVGKVDETVLDEQLDVLNAAFGPQGVKFVKESVDFTQNAAWFAMDLDTPEEAAAKASLGKEVERKLNFYTCQPPGGTLGWARFPWELATAPAVDGVVILHTCLPGGQMPLYNLGDTAVHEVGHWLGLFHTFGENPFDRCIDTDEVSDTPVHHMTFNKPPDTTDTCPSQPGNDPVHNFMSYVDDDWMDRFSPQQVARLHEKIAAFRPQLLPAAVRSRLKP